VECNGGLELGERSALSNDMYCTRGKKDVTRSKQILTVFTDLGTVKSSGTEESDAAGGEDENISSGLELGGEE
jgi:hypothetical protein